MKFGGREIADNPASEDERLIAKAKQLYHRSPSIEVDDDAVISRRPGLEGAYVSAWVLVRDDD